MLIAYKTIITRFTLCSHQNIYIYISRETKHNDTYACVCVCMYVHTCYVLTKPPIPSSSCDHIRTSDICIQILFYITRELTQGSPLVTTLKFIFFFIFPSFYIYVYMYVCMYYIRTYVHVDILDMYVFACVRMCPSLPPSSLIPPFLPPP